MTYSLVARPVLAPQLASAGIKFPTPLRIVDDVVEIRKVLFLREVSQNVDVPIRETICSKDVVVWYNDYLLGIPDLRLLAELTLKNTDTSGTANVVRQKDVGIYPNIFSGGDLALIGTASEDLLRERHRGLEFASDRRPNQAENLNKLIEMRRW